MASGGIFTAGFLVLIFNQAISSTAAHDQHCASNFTDLGSVTELGNLTKRSCSGMSQFLIKGCSISDDCHEIMCKTKFVKKPITLTLKIDCDEPIAFTVTIDVPDIRITWSHTFFNEETIPVPKFSVSLGPVASADVYVQVAFCAKGDGDKVRLRVKLLAGVKLLHKTVYLLKVTVINGNLPFSCGGWSAWDTVGTIIGIIVFIIIVGGSYYCCYYCCYNCCCK